ncbi:unnamed protein product [Lota lota]
MTNDWLQVPAVQKGSPSLDRSKPQNSAEARGGELWPLILRKATEEAPRGYGRAPGLLYGEQGPRHVLRSPWSSSPPPPRPAPDRSGEPIQ